MDKIELAEQRAAIAAKQEIRRQLLDGVRIATLGKQHEIAERCAVKINLLNEALRGHWPEQGNCILPLDIVSAVQAFDIVVPEQLWVVTPDERFPGVAKEQVAANKRIRAQLAISKVSQDESEA